MNSTDLKEVMWAVTLRGRSGVVGGVDLHQWNRYHRRAEIGYSLALRRWGFWPRSISRNHDYSNCYRQHL